MNQKRYVTVNSRDPNFFVFRGMVGARCSKVMSTNQKFGMYGLLELPSSRSHHKKGEFGIEHVLIPMSIEQRPFQRIFLKIIERSNQDIYLEGKFVVYVRKS
jgi:hypothetical protein